MPGSLSKRRKEFDKLVEKDKLYNIDEGISILKKAPKTKFDQTVELAIKLDMGGKQASQPVRGTVTLPHGTGKQLEVSPLSKPSAKMPPYSKAPMSQPAP